jgi:hypothetical protein
MPMHTFPDVHTKTKKDNLQEGSGEIKINEPIEETQDNSLKEMLKDSKPLSNNDDPIEFNERKRKQIGNDIHESFLHPSYVKTSKIIIEPPKKTKTIKKSVVIPSKKEIKHKFKFA